MQKQNFMSDTYYQIQLHFILFTKGRQPLITEYMREQVEKYIYTLVAEKKCRVLAIYCNPDHTHILVSLHPEISCSKLMEFVKSNSSRFINSTLNPKTRFEWRRSFSVFSIRKSHEDVVIRYIQNQKSHHAKKDVKQEYIEILEEEGIEYKKEFLFNDK